jgi:hypothetical protein
MRALRGVPYSLDCVYDVNGNRLRGLESGPCVRRGFVRQRTIRALTLARRPPIRPARQVRQLRAEDTMFDEPLSCIAGAP